MPSSKEFRKAFAVDKGLSIPLHIDTCTDKSSKSCKVQASLFVSDIRCGHRVVKQFQTYEFPMKIELELRLRNHEDTAVEDEDVEIEVIQAALSSHIQCQIDKQEVKSSYLVVYSHLGSPYDCAFNIKREEEDGYTITETSKGHYLVSCCGRAERNRELMTLSQLEKEKKRGRNEGEDGEDLDIDLSKLSVLSSRFGSSKCAICGDIINIGAKICRGKGVKRGKWSHLGCYGRKEIQKKKKMKTKS